MIALCTRKATAAVALLLLLLLLLTWGMDWIVVGFVMYLHRCIVGTNRIIFTTTQTIHSFIHSFTQSMSYTFSYKAASQLSSASAILCSRLIPAKCCCCGRGCEESKSKVAQYELRISFSSSSLIIIII